MLSYKKFSERNVTFLRNIVLNLSLLDRLSEKRMLLKMTNGDMVNFKCRLKIGLDINEVN